MVTVFFEVNGIMHYEFLPQDQMINKEYYLRVLLRRLREAIQQKRFDLWRSNSWQLQHYNAPAHTNCLFSNFIFLLDLTSWDFSLFAKLKRIS